MRENECGYERERERERERKTRVRCASLDDKYSLYECDSEQTYLQCAIKCRKVLARRVSITRRLDFSCFYEIHR